jgi:hypothetical protein
MPTGIGKQKSYCVLCELSEMYIPLGPPSAGIRQPERTRNPHDKIRPEGSHV